MESDFSILADDLLDLNATRAQKVCGLSILLMAVDLMVPVPTDIFVDDEEVLTLMWAGCRCQLGVDIFPDGGTEYWHVKDSDEDEQEIWEQLGDTNIVRRHFFGRVISAQTV